MVGGSHYLGGGRVCDQYFTFFNEYIIFDHQPSVSCHQAGLSLDHVMLFPLPPPCFLAWPPDCSVSFASSPAAAGRASRRKGGGLHSRCDEAPTLPASMRRPGTRRRRRWLHAVGCCFVVGVPLGSLAAPGACRRLQAEHCWVARAPGLRLWHGVCLCGAAAGTPPRRPASFCLLPRAATRLVPRVAGRDQFIIMSSSRPQAHYSSHRKATHGGTHHYRFPSA